MVKSNFKRVDTSKFELEQLRLSKLVVIPESYIIFKPDDLIFTFDVQYENDFAYLAIDVQELKGKHIGTFVKRYNIPEKYIAGFFAFREGPIILKGLIDLCKQKNFKAKLLIVDGHGTAHPRGLGLASWVGIKTMIPTIGLAKNSLINHNFKINKEQGSIVKITKDKIVVGNILKIQEKTKPVFVSSGNLISQKQTVDLVFTLRGKFRIIEPLRRADHAARNFAKNISSNKFIILV